MRRLRLDQPCRFDELDDPFVAQQGAIIKRQASVLVGQGGRGEKGQIDAGTRQDLSLCRTQQPALNEEALSSPFGKNTSGKLAKSEAVKRCRDGLQKPARQKGRTKARDIGMKGMPAEPAAIDPKILFLIV